MFYSIDLLSPKGALGQIWILAHQPTRAKALTRHKSAQLSVATACNTIMKPPSPLALRLAALLMRGVVALYNRQLHFLYEDCASVMTRLCNFTAHAAAHHNDRNTLEADKEHAQREALIRDYDLDLIDEDPQYGPGGTYAQLALAAAANDSSQFVTMPSLDQPRSDEMEEEDEVLGWEGGTRTAAAARSGMGAGGKHTARSVRDITLPETDIAMLMDQLAGEMSDEEHGGGHGGVHHGRDDALVPGGSQAHEPLDWDTERQPTGEVEEEQEPLPLHDEEEAAFIPMPGEEDDDMDLNVTHGTAGDGGIGSTFGTGGDLNSSAAVNVTHDSIAPSPAQQAEMQKRQRGARGPRSRRMRVDYPFDEDVHVSSDIYRTWLADPSDLMVPSGGRPSVKDLGILHDTVLRARFFDSMFQMFGAEAHSGINDRVKAHFTGLVEAKWLPEPPRRARKARVKFADERAAGVLHGMKERNPDELLQDAAEHHNHVHKAGDSEDSYQPVLLNDQDEDDDEIRRRLEPQEMETELDIFQLGTQATQTQTQPGVLKSAERQAFASAGRGQTPSSMELGHGGGLFFTPSSRAGFSLADLLDGRVIGEGQDAVNYSIGASMDHSFRVSDGIHRTRFGGSEGPMPSPISMDGPSQSMPSPIPERLTQYKLKESGPMFEDREGDEHGKAMLAAAQGASVNDVGQPAYNLLQFLSANIFNGFPLGTGSDSGIVAVSLSWLCTQYDLPRSKAAKCFYQCLVLVGGGFIDAAQDLSEPYGEILIRPGGKFYGGGGVDEEIEEEEEEPEEEETVEI